MQSCIQRSSYSMSSVSVILQVYAAATRMYFSNKLKPIRTDMLLLSWQTKDMELANISFRLLAISQVLLFILLVVCADNPRRIRVVGALLISGIIAYLLMPLVIFYTPYPSQVNYLWFVATMTPSLLLLFVWFIFEENRRLPQWIIALVSFSAGSSLWFELTNGGLPGAPWWLQATKIIISGLVIYVVWRGRDNDLVAQKLGYINGVLNLYLFYHYELFLCEIEPELSIDELANSGRS